MTQYIDKDALVAEIERRIEEHKFLAAMAADNNLHNTLEANELLIGNYSNLIHFINTLEVKEVDLEKEIDNYFNTSIRKNIQANDNVTLFMQVRKTAKHFFELGIKTQKGE